MKFFIIISLLTSLLFAETDFEAAYRVYKSNNFEQSLQMFTHLVDEKKDYDAAYILGYMYENGEGCEVNIAKSQMYYKLSSHGYYWQNKPDPSRDIQKEYNRLYTSLDKSKSEITQKTIQQYTQSLYNIKAYGANYFLPISYRLNGNYPPTNGHEALQSETEFQLSIKYDYAVNILGFNEIYSVGYTQLSFWQLYADSAYFRETNYNPEVFITLPVQKKYFKAIKIAFAHQSNGRGGVEERSWNFVSLSSYFQTAFFFTHLKLWHNVFSLEYNPNLMNYIGYGEVELIFPYEDHILKIKSRNIFSKYRATEFNYSYPFIGSKDLFFYFKGFSGYGESLIDYNKRVDKIGFGFSISR
ncbi:phospholipase A [Sulfurimonas sp. SAG-AH-194-C20]|nr:phospholipase A [Sulfurimonas sp. SAG-AH-194-C20]MDF1878934.1 phospholipase A [Sulfurimonas sp. SAG-AH-194-C20]